jgi:hypothetical protein
MTTSALQKEFEYFLNNKKQLLEQYEGRFVVIKNEKVIGAFDSQATAVFETSKKEPLGTFLVQKVTKGDEAYKQVFHSRVAVAPAPEYATAPGPFSHDSYRAIARELERTLPKDLDDIDLGSGLD